MTPQMFKKFFNTMNQENTDNVEKEIVANEINDVQSPESVEETGVELTAMKNVWPKI
jgi:hypothetical protein